MTEPEMMLELQARLGLPLPMDTPPAFFNEGLEKLDAARKHEDESESDQALEDFKTWSDSVRAAFGEES